MTRFRKCVYCKLPFNDTDTSFEYLEGILHKAGGAKRSRMFLCPSCTVTLKILIHGPGGS